jgi:sodium/bile acid cotransporter 7
MREILKRRWFLLSLAGGLALAWFDPKVLQPAADRFDLRWAVALALGLMALSVEGQRLLQALARPRPLLWALVVSYGILPALSLVIGWTLDRGLAVGLLLIASVPCTLSSAVVWTRLAGGCEATALLTVFLTTATSWLVTTAWLFYGTGATVGGLGLGLMTELLLILVVPVGIGQLARLLAVVAEFAARRKIALGIVAQVLVLAVILKAAVRLFSLVEDNTVTIEPWSLASAAVLAVAAHLSALAIGYWGSKPLGIDHSAGVAIAFAGSQKSLPVALALYESYFRTPFPLAVVTVVLYHVGQLVADTMVAERLRPTPLQVHQPR